MSCAGSAKRPKSSASKSTPGQLPVRKCDQYRYFSSVIVQFVDRFCTMTTEVSRESPQPTWVWQKTDLQRSFAHLTILNGGSIAEIVQTRDGIPRQVHHVCRRMSWSFDEAVDAQVRFAQECAPNVVRDRNERAVGAGPQEAPARLHRAHFRMANGSIRSNSHH